MSVIPDTEVRPVHYGDFITLYCDDGPGFVYTQVTSSAHFSVAVSVQREKDPKNPTLAKEANPGLRNVHAAAFQVLYPNKFKAQKRLRKLQDLIGMRLQSELSSRELDDLGRVERKSRAEHEDNLQEQKRQKGRNLQYGQVVELLHSFTKRYLCVSKTSTSILEPNNMQIKLSDHGEKHCRFKVLPRYKVRSIGDKVMFGDQIQLESMKTDGQYVHCSRMLFSDKKSSDEPISTEEQSKELNLSGTQSALAILPYFSLKKEHDANAVQAGSIIRLFHGEVEGYLVAEGSFIEQFVVENVHLRLRPVDQNRPRSLYPSTSAITYWQIEMEKASGSGEVINWEQRCRLRHVCTRKYLCLSKQEQSDNSDKSGSIYSLSLTNEPGLSTVFRLFSVTEESDSVYFDAYCRIEHAQSKRWLHALQGDYKKKRLVQADSTSGMSMENLEWDDAKLKQIGSSEVMCYNDAFTIQKVEEKHVNSLNYTAGMIPVIEQYLRNRKAGIPLTRRTAARIQTALGELGAYQIKNGEPVKDRQKLLRNFRIIELLAKILNLHDPSETLAENDKASRNQVLVWQAVYHLLQQYLVGNSRKNELYVAKYIPLFQRQIGIGLHAETMVMELVRDNRKIVDRIEENQIDRFVDFLKQRREYCFLDFLGVLCVCNGVAIPLNQEYVTKKLLQENESIVYLTECGDALQPPRDAKMVYVSEDNGVNWTPLTTFAEDQENNQKYLFLERQLDLFSLLCYGKNEYAIKVITEELRYLTWKEAFLCLKSKILPNHLRAKYCSVVIGMFIDVGENRSVLDKLCLSYVFHDVESKPYSSAAADPKEAITGARMEFFPDLRDWIERFLAENGNMQASATGHNELLTEVLRVLHYLIAFGYYANVNDIKALLPPLLSVIDGRNDEPFPDARGTALAEYRNTSRFEQNENNKKVVNAKHMAMQVIDLLFNFRFNIRLERFIYEFRRVSDGDDTTPLRPLMENVQVRLKKFRFSARRQMGTVGTEYFALMKPENECDILNDDHLASFARAQLEGVLDESSFLEGKEMDLILRDLSNYCYDKMVIASMQLMSRYFSANSVLFDRAVQAQVLIHPQSIETFHYVEKTLPILRRLLTAKMTRDQEIVMGEILDGYIQKCWIHSNGQVTFESHKMNQTILYNFGVLADLIDILEKEIDIGLEEYAGLREIFRKCFILLQALAHGNAVVQKRLYRGMDRLLAIRVAEPQMANALTEVFTGNQEMCMNIRSYQVQRVVALVAVYKSSASELLDLLNAVVKIEELDLPLKRNQGFVMTAINQKRASVCGILEVAEADFRLKLIKGGDLNNPDLNYLLRLVDLLSTCAEGENRFIESMCQNIFSVEDLFEILLDSSVIVACKRPYLRFLVWVYLNTGSGKVESGAGDLDHDPNMWSFLKQVSSALDEVNVGLRSLVEDPSKIQAVQKSLRVGGRMKAFSTGETNAKKPSKLQKRGSLSGALLDEGFMMYFFDGLLPFLQVFYSNYFQPQEDFMHRHEISTSRTLANTLIDLSDVLPKFVGSENQYQSLRRAVTNILAHPVLKIPADKVSQFDVGGLSGIDVRSPALKQYQGDYLSEENLNVQLNNFAVNFKRAYQKKNTICDQIGIPSDKQYCEKEDEDEPLPLGQEFQDHVKAFSKGAVADRCCEKLIAQLHVSYSSPELRDLSETEQVHFEQLSIRSLQVLRAILHNQIVQVPELEAEKIVEKHDKAMVSVLTAQGSLNALKAPLEIIPLVSHHNDDIVRETLAFLSCLLYRGNGAVQDSFADYFLHTREEKFFVTVQGRLRRSAVAIRERRALWSQHKAKAENSARMMDTLRETIGRKKGSRSRKSRLAAIGKVSDECEMEEVKKNMKCEQDVQKAESNGGSDQFKFRDDGYIEIILRILGFLCDGHNKILQDYLREQPDNIKSFNLVSETCDYLLLFYNSIDSNNIPLVVQTFVTLVELASGNQENQATLFDHSVIDMVNDVMRMEISRFAEDGDLAPEDVYKLKQSAMDLLASMVEKNDEMTKCLVKEVMETIDVDALYESMRTFQNTAESLDKDAREACLKLAFTIQQVLARFQNFGQLRHKPSKEESEADKKLEESSMSVEIWDGETLQQVYFRVKDKKALREEVKEQLKWSISRESPTDKLRDFLEWAKDIEKDVHYQRRIRRHRLVALFLQGHLFWYWIVLLLTLALNVFILATWKAPADIFARYPEVGDFFHPILYSVGGLHLFFTVCMAITFYLSNAHNFVLPFFFYLIVKKKLPAHSHSSINIFGMKSIFYMLFVAASVLSLLFDGFFYCFHLFIIVNNNDILLRVLQSVTRNGVSLLWVAALMVIIIYVYSVVAFAFLRQSFINEEGLFCDNLGECFISSLKFGLLTGGGLGEALHPKTYGFLEPGLRTLFDLSYFLIITIIALNIVFGIIVDTFSELRDDKWKAQNDMMSVCFICGIASHEFDKRGTGFEYHVKKRHNMWAYLFYFIHLSEKLPNDYTSIESYVVTKRQKGHIDFFPLNKAICLLDGDDTGTELIQELKNMMKKLLDRHEREDANVRRRKERHEQALWERKQGLVRGAGASFAIDENGEL